MKGVAMTPETTPPYSFAADLLSKFHTSPDWIQALWLIAVPALVFGIGWLVKEMVVALARRRQPEGELLLSVYRRVDGGVVVYGMGGDQRQRREPRTLRF
jgi:hypothetical protein